MENPSRIKALLGCRCPSCKTGKVFDAPAYHPVRFHHMPSSCPVCGFHFMPEPGFYFGAMYVSYAFTVAVMTAIWLALYLLVKPSELVYILSMIGGVVAIAPVSFRYSRMVWLYWFG